ncbi:hypothetical protein F0562_002068 [Nyssa sinensis]|uniref:Uncharacterized protein n=1 Tax=Nyssa sinensis TaxID=561372 RepID=A0A5J5C6D4_9ASTE|nr:hypothetical protein F0562_002068 [Nyssa sinensis]
MNLSDTSDKFSIFKMCLPCSTSLLISSINVTTILLTLSWNRKREPFESLDAVDIAAVNALLLLLIHVAKRIEEPRQGHKFCRYKTRHSYRSLFRNRQKPEL